MTIKERLLLRLLIGCFALSGCSSAPKTFDFRTQPLLLDTKIQIKDLRKGESQNAKIEVVVLTNQAIRLDVTALFGYAVATVIMTPDKIQYALHTAKKYAEGPFSSRTLFPVFKQNVDPNIVWNVVHNRNPASGDLKCKTDAKGLPLSCINADGVVVTWLYENSIKRRIDIKNQQFEMTWVFKDQKALNAAQNETFVLKKPEDYQQIQIK